jgi:hypothetical protein
VNTKTKFFKSPSQDRLKLAQAKEPVFIQTPSKATRFSGLNRNIRIATSNIIESNEQVQREYYGAVPTPRGFQNIEIGRSSHKKARSTISTLSTPR